MDTKEEQGIDLVKTGQRRKKQAHNNRNTCLVDHVVLDDLPENCMFDILVRLPVETLCSLRFVCKSWYKILSSPDFRNAHLHRSSDTTPRGFIFMTPVRNNSSPPKKVFSVESNSMLIDRKFSHHMKFVEIEDGKKSIKEYNAAFESKIIATCNGLVVLERYPKTGLIILNPITKELEDIPLGTTISSTSQEHDLYGLAYCQVSGRYKLLHLFTKDKLRNLGCEIMDIRSGSWRAVDVPPIERHFDLLKNPIFAMGALHWIQYVVGRGQCIVSMPLGDERFKTMTIPETGGTHFKFNSVFAMGEFLGYASRLQRRNHQIGVWILRGECGWKKQYNIDVASGLLRYDWNNLTLLNYCGGEFVFKCQYGRLIVYDRHSRLMREIETTDERAANFFFRTSFPHMNSLVSWRS